MFSVSQACFLFTMLFPTAISQSNFTCNCENDALFLTSYIEHNEIEKAQQLATVPPMLPNIESFSGFLTVNKTAGSNLFFWLFKSQQGDWEQRPLVVWLTGGPGYSSLFALFHEIGPFSVAEGMKLKHRKYSWNRKCNLVFIDNPVGAGFSFTKMESGYARDENDVSRNLYEAMVQLYKLFPTLQRNKLFITGESYAGKYGPAIAYKIYKMNQVSSLKMNLAGLLIGNGWTDPINQLNHAALLFQLGLIDKRTQDVLIVREDETRALIRAGKFGEATEEILARSKEGTAVTGLVSFYDLTSGYFVDNHLVDAFINDPKTRTALHVGSCGFNETREVVSKYLLSDLSQSVRPWVEELLTAEHFPILFYSGQLDIAIAYSVSVDFYNALVWPRAAEYHNASRCQFKVNGEVAGYYKTAGTFTEMLVRNAGHMVPMDQPRWAYELFDRFISNISYFKCE